MTRGTPDVETAVGIEISSLYVDGQRLRVGIRRGDGESAPLLMFNGVGANLELVEPFIAAMPDVEVVIFDIPGVGGSPPRMLPYRFSSIARLADKLLRKLGYVGPVDVIGVSWGGALAQQFAHQYPARCRRLVLAATSPGVIMVPGKLPVLWKLINPRRYRDPAYLKAVGGALYGGAYRSDARLLLVHGRQTRSPRGRGYLYQLLAGWGWSSLWWLRSLPQPTLVMHGTDDPIIPLINARVLSWLIPMSRLYVIDDGHLFLISRAREVASVVRAFLADDGTQV